MGSMHLKLKPSPWRMLFLLLLSSCLAVFGVFLAFNHDAVMGWFFVGLFGLVAIQSIRNLLPGSNYLEIRPDGMEIRSNYKTWFVPWIDVKEFFPAYVKQRSSVCWNYASSPPEQRLARRITANIAGFEAALPDTYGMSTQALCNLLNDWRTTHGAAP